MALIRSIDLKVWRELWRMRGQFLAIALVIACGVGVFIGMRSTMLSLEQTRAHYYATERFADLFVSLERAPEHVSNELRSLPQIQTIQTRVVATVTLDIEGMVEVVSGRLVSIPDHNSPKLNDLHLTRGRLPEAARADEVVANEAFAEAHEFELGDTIRAVINGRDVELRIVGVALCPEYTYSVGPGLLFPDDRRFGVMWMRRAALASAFDLKGAFNDVSIRLVRNASPEEAIARVDAILDPYGSLGAIARSDQQSAAFLRNELTQLDTFSFFVPLLFLIVSAFLLNIVFGRMISGQRSDIAALKAFGYRDREVGLHYAKLIGLVVLIGWASGLLLGLGIGQGMTQMYARYYRFPNLDFQLRWTEALFGLAITSTSAGLGAWNAIRRTIRLAPAEALRPEAPPIFRPTIFERLGLARFLPVAVRLILRELERRPTRAIFAGLGVAFAAALTISMAFTLDSMQHVLNLQYGLSQREDVQVSLSQPRTIGALTELEALPGVIHAEPLRTVPVTLSSGRHAKKIAITGIDRASKLVGLLDERYVDVPIPSDGLVISRKLAEILQTRPGAELQVQVLEGDRPQRSVVVARVVENFVGISAHMSLHAVSRLLREAPTMNGAYLLIDDHRLADLHAAVKETPFISGVTSRDAVLGKVREMLDQNLGTFVGISVGFSLIMAFGVLYNVVRITLAERARELATLRVLGFRRKEVTAILFGELAIVLAVALPVGMLFGYGLASALVQSPGYDTEQFRLPFVIQPRTYAMAALTILAAALASAWGAWRRLEQFDIVEVLKTRD